MHRRRLGGDAGSATTEFVIATPAFLFTLMLIVQAGLYFHAVSITSAAAQDGARAAAVGGTEADLTEGENVATGLITELAPQLLTNVQANASLQDANEVVRMEVSGDVATVFVFPGMDIDFSIDESAESAIERFRPVGEAPVDTSP
jgi:Flp pilus assembly protein TadG